MSLADWQRQNNAYLATALHWLRLRLEALDKTNAEPVSRGGLRGVGKANNRAAASPRAIQKAADHMLAAEQAALAPAMVLLRERFGLSPFEQSIMLLCAALELDTRIARLCAQAQGDPARTYPTFALALVLFDDPAWDALSPERPLRYWQLIEISRSSAHPLTNCPLRADERVVNFLKGVNYVDDRLAPLVMVLSPDLPGIDLPPSQKRTADMILRLLKDAESARRLPVIQLIGTDSQSKQLVVAHTCRALDLPLYRLPVDLLPGTAADLDLLVRLWLREITFRPLALYLDASDTHMLGESDNNLARMRRFLARSLGLFFIDARDVQTGIDRPTIVLDVDRPTTAEQGVLWTGMLPVERQHIALRLASQFNLNTSTIVRIAHTTPDALDPLWDACLAYSRPRLDVLAQRIDARAAWDDIVLPDEQMRLLRQIVNQVHDRNTVYEQWGFGPRLNRGTGISALFTGESGTGKTMAAEVIANELRLHLYRIDLSAVVSKYIGETEKNLRQVFDAAEDGGAILFFDEADALFGKRTEVRDSHDRYANIEVNYLLQRMEAYRGVAILATNMKTALDQAFMRRLRFVINFPFPNPEHRRAIWQKSLPPELPVHTLDFDYLAQLNLTGGNISNVVLNAAFMAANAGTPVTMPLVLDAARMEFRKLDRPINEAVFRWDRSNGSMG